MPRVLLPTAVCNPWCLGAALLVLLLAGAGCTGTGDPPVQSRQTPLVELVRSATPGAIRLGEVPDLTVEQGVVVVRGGWGSATGQFGKRDEASRPGPMGLAIAKDGTIHVLDQVNKRVQRFDPSGRHVGQVPVSSETTEAIALSGEDLWTLSYEPGATPGYAVTRHDDEGQTRVALDRSMQLVTGLFVTGSAAAPDVWVELRHERQLRVVEAGRALAPRQQRTAVLGRPYRGQHVERLSATRAGRSRALVIHVVPGRTTRPLFEVTTPLPLVAIHELASDRAGNVYLGLLLGRDAGPPHHGLTDGRRVLLVQRGPASAPVTIELARGRVTDAFRPLAIGPDGSVYQLHTTEQEVTVRRWALPAASGGGR